MLKSNDSASPFEFVQPNELVWFYSSSLILWKDGVVDNMEDVARMMVKGGPMILASAKPTPPPDNRPDKSLWEAVKHEMFLFLCADDKKYRKLWSEVRKVRKKGTTAVVTVISAALGASIGVAATLVSAFVAVCIYAILKIGKEAYCSVKAQSLPMPSIAPKKRIVRKAR